LQLHQRIFGKIINVAHNPSFVYKKEKKYNASIFAEALHYLYYKDKKFSEMQSKMKRKFMASFTFHSAGNIVKNRESH
jgi:hypothetical protein